MSRAAQLARDEADEVEAAEEDETEAGTVTPAPEPEPEPEDEEPVGEQAMAAMEKESERHAKAVAKLLGPAADQFHACPLCEVFPDGFVPSADTVPAEMLLELQTAVQAYFAGQAEPEYLPAEDAERCSKCGGYGEVLSGALKENTRTKVCTPCGGLGYVPKYETTPAPAPAPVYTGAPAPTVTVEANYQDFYGNPSPVPPDHAGRPFLHPQYGYPVEHTAPLGPVAA